MFVLYFQHLHPYVFSIELIFCVYFHLFIHYKFTKCYTKALRNTQTKYTFFKNDFYTFFVIFLMFLVSKKDEIKLFTEWAFVLKQIN